MGLAEVNTFLLMHAKGIGQVRQKHFTKVLAKELLENPWIMAELLTDRQQALRMCPLIAAMVDLGGGSTHPLVAHKEVTSKSGEDMHVRKVKQQRFVMFGRKASAACEGCPPGDDGGCHGGMSTELDRPVVLDVGDIAPPINTWKCLALKLSNEHYDAMCDCAMRVHGPRDLGRYCPIGRRRADVRGVGR
eukprot:scaffold1724_cov341-Pavlova_lutheri.AAC.87